MLKLKLQYFGHVMQRADSFEKTLMLGKIVGRRRRGRQSTPRGLLVWGPSGLLSRLLETSTRGRQLHEGSPDAPSRCRP